MPTLLRLSGCATALIFLLAIYGCATSYKECASSNNAGQAKASYPGQPAPRQDDEIVAAGQFFHTGAPVVLWFAPNGYDAYRQARWFAKRPNKMADYLLHKNNPPNHYGIRAVNSWSKSELYKLRRGQWTLKQLRGVINKIVLHYDACGTSQKCFEVLQKRGLSTQFMLDLDGTIYQTMDLKERAWTAGIANDHSINIEIANIGAYPPDKASILKKWYHQSSGGPTTITIPKGYGHELHPNLGKHPARPNPISGQINGRMLTQYDYTPAQYRSLIKLTAALHRIFPKIKLQVPRNQKGAVLMSHPLTHKQLKQFHGIIGHQHVTIKKEDPGPAFQWNWFLDQVKKTLNNTAASCANGQE